MITMYTTSTEASEGHLAHRNKLRKRNNEEDVSISLYNQLEHEHKDDALQHPHVKQIFDFLTWHIGVADAKWYVKPRSTCWFEEYLLNIYTPDMFSTLFVQLLSSSQCQMQVFHSSKPVCPCLDPLHVQDTRN